MSVNVKSMHQGKITSFFTPSATLIGRGGSEEIPASLKKLGAHKPLLVTDQGLVRVGIVEQVMRILDAAGVPYAVYDGTAANPTDRNVAEALALYKKEACDSLLTLGGGSAHDCGKGVGFLLANGGKLQDYEGIRASSNPFPPFVAVNTTAGSAAEMSRFCMITDTSRRVKMVLADWRCVPGVVISDMAFIMGMPSDLTVAVSMEALSLAVEAYVSTQGTPLTDACVEKAMEYLGIYIRRAMSNLQDQEAREGLCYAQTLAGMASSNAGPGLVQAMAHQLGAFYDLPHGECCAVLLPHVCRYNMISNRRRYAWLAFLMGEHIDGLSSPEASQKFLLAVNTLSRDVNLPEGLAALGRKHGKQVREEDIPAMTANALKDSCVLTNTRDISAEAVAGIYRAAL